MQSLHKKEQVKNIAALFEKGQLVLARGRGATLISGVTIYNLPSIQAYAEIPFKLSESYMFKRFKSRWALSGKKFSLVVMVHLTLFEWVTKVPGQKLNSGEREIPIKHIQHLTPRKQRKIVMLNAGNKFNT